MCDAREQGQDRDQRIFALSLFFWLLRDNLSQRKKPGSSTRPLPDRSELHHRRQLFQQIGQRPPKVSVRGYVTDGSRRALEWHSRGQRFDPAYLHQYSRGCVQKTVETTRFQRFFCCLQHTAKQDFLRVLVRLIFDPKILNQGDRKMKKIKMK